MTGHRNFIHTFNNTFFKGGIRVDGIGYYVFTASDFAAAGIIAEFKKIGKEVEKIGKNEYRYKRFGCSLLR